MSWKKCESCECHSQNNWTSWFVMCSWCTYWNSKFLSPQPIPPKPICHLLRNTDEDVHDNPTGLMLALKFHICIYVYIYIYIYIRDPKLHDDVIKWKHFPRYWSFVRGIHRSPVVSPHKGQSRGALMFSLICAWINGRANNRNANDLKRHQAHYDVTVMDHLCACRYTCPCPRQC